MKFYYTVALLFLLTACSKEEVSVSEPILPSYFPNPSYYFEDNPYTKEKFELGRQLFYDPILSKDSTISCASCHAQNYFFSGENVAISAGVQGKMGNRNAPTIFNLLWNTSFMWDGGVNHIELSGFPAMIDSNEMNETVAHILEKLENTERYPTLFNDAYGTEEIDDQKMFYALTQFTGSLISANAKYDKLKQGKATFNELETQGFTLFKSHCNTCHTEPLFTDYSFRNNGLTIINEDYGRYRVTQLEEDRGKFKVPTLRNVLHTFPYMHNGSVANMDAVFEHYCTGINVSTQNLDISLQTPRCFTPLEKEALLAFLETLSDYELMNNGKFAQP